MKHPILATATAVMMTLASAGCASTPEADQAEAPTQIEVRNHNPLTVTVDAVSSGEDYRLGQVETSDSETFTMPRNVDELDVRILVDPIGSSNTYLSDELVYSPGAVIDVDVESNLALTTVTIR